MLDDEKRQIKMRSFATRFGYMLDKSGMSQRKLAEVTGVTEVSISRYINGKRLPHPIILEKICTALDCDADWLIGIEKTGDNTTKEIKVIRRNKKSSSFDVDGTCDTCKYHDDPEYVCRVRQCVHAVSCLYDLYEAEEQK